MKIALVGLTHPFRGGIAHYTTLLCRALRRRHEVRFFSLTRQYPRLLFPGKTQQDDSGTPFREDNEPCLDSIQPLTWLGTARRIRRFAPDLILFSWWNPFFAPSFGSVARLARWGKRIPACFLCHNVIPHEPSALDRGLSRYAFSAGSAFITHSEEDGRQLRLLRPRAAVFTSPHPTYDAFVGESAPPADAARAELGLSGKKVLLFFGYVRRYKGLDTLLEAMDRLGPDDGYHLLVVGEFYEGRAKYREALGRLERSDRLTLVDRYVANEEVPRYFAAADLVMVPYLSATQSGIVQMAYAFGKPVVASRVGGLPEAVLDGETGFLVPPADAGAIASAVRRFFETGDRQRFARRIAAERDRYSWDRMVETVERVVQELSSGDDPSAVPDRS